MGFFRVRSQQRDQETDQRRFGHLVDELRKTGAQIEREATGLRDRCEKARCSASFAMDHMEGDTSDGALDDQVRVLSDTIMSCERRLDALDNQIEFLRLLEQQIAEFSETGSLEHSQPALSNRTASSLPNR